MNKLLIIDDNLPLLECLTVAFEDYFIIKTTASAQKALKQIHEFKPDIVLVDNKMPEMSGLDFLRNIMDYKDPLRRVMYSAFFSYEELKTAKALGVVAWIEKPFRLAELKELLLGHEP